jgi:hypothetical protein
MPYKKKIRNELNSKNSDGGRKGREKKLIRKDKLDSVHPLRTNR